MSPRVSRNLKIYFGAVAVLAVLVFVVTVFAPNSADRVLPLSVPALHARFIGAMYLSGLVYMVGACIARQWPSVRVVVPMAALWTGWLFVVSLINVSDFDFARNQVKIWFISYPAIAIVGAAIAWQMRRHSEPGSGPGFPRYLREYLLIQGVVILLLAALLFLLPGTAVDIWPWKMTTLLAQL